MCKPVHRCYLHNCVMKYCSVRGCDKCSSCYEVESLKAESQTALVCMKSSPQLYMQVTIANAIQWRFTVWLCVFGVLGLIPFATVRAHNNPPVAKSVGPQPYPPQITQPPC